MSEPTIKQLEYLNRIVSQLPEWTEPPPTTKDEASLQIDRAKSIWAIENSGNSGEIY